jgi:hypothetical protein
MIWPGVGAGARGRCGRADLACQRDKDEVRDLESWPMENGIGLLE